MDSHSTTPDDHGSHGDAHVHALPLWLLAAVFAALIVLTAATVAVTLVDLGYTANLLVALLIAVVKAALVCLYFMHLRYDHPFFGMIVVASFVFVSIFIAGALTDSREYQPNIVAKDLADPAAQTTTDE